MEMFLIGLMVGLAVGLVVLGFLAIGSYNRGYDEAVQGRRAWRAELVARQTVAARSLQPARKAG